MSSHYLVSGKQWEGNRDIDSGVYQLFMRRERSGVIVVGALGSHTFPAGAYIYTGRASRGLSKRITRHLSKEKRLRWHIDYFLEHARVEAIRVYPGEATEECSINSETARALQGVFPVKGFGSSDCRCASHLILIPDLQCWDIQNRAGIFNIV